jgi:hypothetical protein
MAEAIYLLAQYKSLAEADTLDFSAISSSLTEMTPAGLATKSFKLLSGLSRKPNPTASGI